MKISVERSPNCVTYVSDALEVKVLEKSCLLRDPITDERLILTPKQFHFLKHVFEDFRCGEGHEEENNGDN